MTRRKRTVSGQRVDTQAVFYDESSKVARCEYAPSQARAPIASASGASGANAAAIRAAGGTISAASGASGAIWATSGAISRASGAPLEC